MNPLKENREEQIEQHRILSRATSAMIHELEGHELTVMDMLTLMGRVMVYVEERIMEAAGGVTTEQLESMRQMVMSAADSFHAKAAIETAEYDK